jgi:hypothetical protein
MGSLTPLLLARSPPSVGSGSRRALGNSFEPLNGGGRAGRDSLAA